MIDINFIKENPALFMKLMKQRNVEISIEEITALEKKKKEKISELQHFQTERNALSKTIGNYKRESKETISLESKVSVLKKNIVDVEKNVNELEKKLYSILLKLPNLPDTDVPIGIDDSFNKVITQRFEVPKFNYRPLSHDILGKNINMMDFSTSATISGSRFVILKADLASLERALINFMLELHAEKHGYTEVSAPHLVKKETLIGTGQLPKFEKDLFRVGEDKWLIPTAEVTLTNFYRNNLLLENNLPLRMVTVSNCYRSEAGSAGQDTKGMIRLHEFKKVELVSFVTKDNSNIELERLLNCASEVLEQLKLPYRIIQLSTGDMGFAASKTFDIEVWIPSQNKYREISSCSNCKDFQARRMNTKYKDQNGNKEFVHTLNGSGLAVGRTLLAILENYQIDEKTIKIPDILLKYMNGKKEICI